MVYISFMVFITALLGGCTTMSSVFATNSNADDERKPIQNPFGEYYSQPGSANNQNMVLRTKKGDRAVEVELPNSGQNISDFVIPVSPAFKEQVRSPASSEIDETYKDRPPTMSDREIARTFPQNTPEDDATRRDVEQGLGLVPAEDATPDNPKSYLAAVAFIKQLYIQGHYERSLIEVDTLIKQYPTDPKLYSMRGTLLDRLGRTDLAMKSWNQALRFDPTNQSLKRFVERRQQKRSVASQ